MSTATVVALYDRTEGLLDRTEGDVAQEDLREIARRVRTLTGPALCVYLSGAGSLPQFVGWLDKTDSARRDRVAQRLTATLELAATFRQARSLSMMRAWLRAPDEQLGGRRPSAVIRNALDDKAMVDLRSAASDYLLTRRARAS
jgi:hypothetical protein